MNNQNGICDVCGSGYGRCGRCGNMCGFGGRHILRWILGILIITWVFSIGMKFGEINAALEDHWGKQGGMMMYRAGAPEWTTATAAGNVMFTKAVPAGQ